MSQKTSHEKKKSNDNNINVINHNIVIFLWGSQLDGDNQDTTTGLFYIASLPNMLVSITAVQYFAL